MMSSSNRTVYGINSVRALLNSNAKIYEIYVSQERKDTRIVEVLDAVAQKNIKIYTLAMEKLNQKFPDVVHQGVVAIANPISEYNEKDLENLLEKNSNPKLILILDGVTDPHNLGASIRSADGAGVDFVVIPKDKSAKVTPVTAKAASGALEFVPLVRVTNLGRTIDMLKQSGVWVYGADGQAKDSLFNMDLKGSIALVMGSEGSGLRRLTKDKCDGLFHLPQMGGVSSLNVSVASGVCLYEALRQRSA